MELQVYKSINAVAAELAKLGISKDRRNAQQGYTFRGIDDVYNALAPLLASNNIVIFPRVNHREQVERVSNKGTATFYTTVEVEYRVVSALDGSSFVANVCGEAMDTADKSTNKAMSAAYKYLCLQLFCIPTEGDNDADATTPEPVKPQQPQQPAQPSQNPVEAYENLLKIKNIENAPQLIDAFKQMNIEQKKAEYKRVKGL